MTAPFALVGVSLPVDPVPLVALLVVVLVAVVLVALLVEVAVLVELDVALEVEVRVWAGGTVRLSAAKAWSADEGAACEAPPEVCVAPDVKAPDVEAPDVEAPDVEPPDVEEVAFPSDCALRELLWLVLGSEDPANVVLPAAG